MDSSLSIKDRLIIANQYEILSRLTEDPHEKKQFENFRDIFTAGFSRYYSLATEYFSDELSDEECKFVIDVLSLYRDLYYSREHSVKAKEVIDEKDVLFNGFDLNDETEVKYLSFYEFLVKQLGRYEEIKELMESGKIESFNSHGFGPSMRKLKKMIDKRKAILKSRDYGYSDDLSIEEIQEIING
ncbi:YfbU family protein [Rummeliibacillus suwonensis]|uniref:YfbU family protein n=1 Tax=Rummeliibacillus suwonensis TaxID=1306154 RepID=UPI0011B79D07|nr:YfbU family protein [Rummeliibacillus suwonensis]